MAEEQCLLHRQPLQFNYLAGCNQRSFMCKECVEDHPQQTEHQVVSEYFLTELTTLTKKNKLRQLTQRYFQGKKSDMLRDLDEQLADVLNFIASFPLIDPLEALINQFTEMLAARPMERTCSEVEAAYNQVRQFCKNNPNPESEANEQQRMRLFEKFEQYSLEFRINSNHALKDLKKRIEGALKQDVPQPLSAKKHFFSNSRIIDGLADCKLICSFLNKKVKGVSMLYRASEHDFCARVFHEKCDGIRNTLTVLRNDLKKTLGGFTPNAWESNLGYLMDVQRETFIFSLDLREKMTLQGKYGIWNSSSYGPAFGYGNFGHDLCICDRADKNKASYAEFPLSFNNQKKYENNQKTWQLFCGQTKGNNFNIIEWQVWRIEFDQ